MQETRFSPAQWDLSEILPKGGEVAFVRQADSIRAMADRFAANRERLARFRSEDVETALGSYERIAEGVGKLVAGSYMRYTTDTADQKAKSALDKAEDLKAEVDNKLLFFRLWWTGLGTGDASRLEPKDADFQYLLGLWRKMKPHTLDEKVEQAVNLKNVTGFSAWTHHYDKIVSGFTFRLKVGGKVVKDPSGKPKDMVVDEVTRLFTAADPKTREAAYRAVLGKYSESGEVLGEVYRTIVRDWKSEYQTLRGYSSPIGARNLENDVSDDAVKTLLQVCRREAKVFQDFFRVKAKMLGMKKMNRFHLYAPLSHKERKVSYEDAVAMVLGAFSEFDSRFEGYARGVFRAGHVDSSPRKGKTNGAYCYSVTPDVLPYVFLNFSGANRDVYTIAHESGHAVHSQLSAAHSVLTYQPPLVLAETASVFGEMILFDKYMREEKDPELKRAVLLEKLSSIYATIGRQAYFVVFENRAHPAVNEGATVGDLCSMYGEVLAEQFGSAVEVPHEFNWEWTYIPHIYHTPFYCYAYAFGNLLSLALYDSYLREGKSFVPRYLKLLAYGGSESPEKILREVGIDVGSASFWSGGFQVVRRMVSDLEKL